MTEEPKIIQPNTIILPEATAVNQKFIENLLLLIKKEIKQIFNDEENVIQN